MRRLAAVLATCALLAAGCGGNGEPAAQPAPPLPSSAAHDTTSAAYSAAQSHPQEDSVYPDVGDPRVDALHYDLDINWAPSTQLLRGDQTLLFRAASTGTHFQLDLERQLAVHGVWLDGKPVDFSHDSSNLVVAAPLHKGDRHILQVRYTGTPEPVAAPTDRSDFSTVGWTITDTDEVWTMQEPYGAYSWYAVNDQPSDKAFYDFTIHAPSPMVGVANGQLRSRTTKAGITTTRWHLASPAASYLTTIAIGKFTETRDTGPHGLPITYWTPSDQPKLIRGLHYTPAAVRYLESKLGRYPYPTLGVLLVDSKSAMETQTMLTLGIGDYTLSHDVLVHELAHQWYGDEVTPADWSDLWMSEGMALYLAEGNWTADHGPRTLSGIARGWARYAGELRARNGPPADYRPGTFGEGNAYYIPGLMWDTIRQRLGDATFWRLVREWPIAHRYRSSSREEMARWWSARSGQDLRPVFGAWLLGPHEPAYHAG
ncbi:MAG: M1 family metallopeptidase [Nocardioides sp.]